MRISDWSSDVCSSDLDSADILAKLHAADVPCEKVATIADVVTNPQVLHRRQIVDVPHPIAGSVPFQAPAFKMWGTPTEISRGAPGPGEHRGDVLKEWLGHSDADLDLLEEHRGESGRGSGREKGGTEVEKAAGGGEKK